MGKEGNNYIPLLKGKYTSIPWQGPTLYRKFPFSPCSTARVHPPGVTCIERVIPCPRGSSATVLVRGPSDPGRPPRVLIYCSAAAFIVPSQGHQPIAGAYAGLSTWTDTGCTASNCPGERFICNHVFVTYLRYHRSDRNALKVIY